MAKRIRRKSSLRKKSTLRKNVLKGRKTMRRKTMRRKTMRRKTMRRKTMRRKNTLKRYTGGKPEGSPAPAPAPVPAPVPAPAPVLDMGTIMRDPTLTDSQKQAIREHDGYPRQDGRFAVDEAFTDIRRMINDLLPAQLETLKGNLPDVAHRLETFPPVEGVLTAGEVVNGIVLMDKLEIVHFIVSQSNPGEEEILKRMDRSGSGGKHPHESEFLRRFMSYSVHKVTNNWSHEGGQEPGWMQSR